MANSHATAACGAIEEHVRDINRHLFREPTALRILPAGLEVLVNPIDALNDDFVLFRQDPEHSPSGSSLRAAGIVARDDLDNIVFVNVHVLSSRRLRQPD
jgi:hypothetical protein